MKKTFSIRRVKNLFSTKKKNFNVNIKNIGLEYQITIASSPIMYATKINAANIQSIFDQITIRILIKGGSDFPLIVKQLEIFRNICMKYDILIYTYCADDTIYIDNICVSSNSYSMSMAINNWMDTGDDENQFFIIMKRVLEEYKNNLYYDPADNEEISFEMIDPSFHRSFRKRYTDVVDRDANITLEILGYTWSKFKLCTTEIEWIWLYVNDDIFNSFSLKRIYSYKEEDCDKTLIKMRLSDFIDLIKSNNSPLSQNTISIINKIINSDVEYFKPLSSILSLEDTYDNEMNEDTEEDEEEDNNINDVINQYLDEILK